MFTLVRRSGAIPVTAVLTMAAAAAALFAQTVPATGPATAPATTTAATTTAPVPSATGLATTRRSSQMAVRWQDAPVDYILNTLSDAFGFVIIKPPGNVPGRITFTSTVPITAPEAISLLNDLLVPIGYTALESKTTDETNRIILRIVTVQEAKKMQIPVHYGANPAEIEVSDKLITQVIPLQTVDAVRLRVDLGPLMSQEADVTANTGANSIIITDTSAKIHRLVEIISALDHQSTIQNALDKVHLEYATAADAARLINDIFNPQNTSVQQAGGGGGGAAGRGAGGGRGAGAAGTGGGSTPGPEGAARLGRVFASSDPRTNTVVVTGPPDGVKAAAELLRKIDADPAVGTIFFVHHLKNAQSIDLAPVLNAMFGGTTTGGGGAGGGRVGGAAGGAAGGRGGAAGGGRGGAAGGGRGGGAAAGGLGGGFALGGGAGGGRGGAAGGGRGGAAGGGRAGGGVVAGGARGGAAGSGVSSSLAGQVYVVPNVDTNSLLVTTDEKLRDRVIAIISELDRPVPQVLIKVLIAEVTHNNGEDIGFEFSFPNSGWGISAGTDFGLAAAPGGFKVGLVQSQVDATLRALANQNKLDVLSRPYILAQDNQDAYMIIGQEVPYITSSQVTNTGQTINSVSYTNVGIILDVVPHINPEGLVTLDVSPEVSQLDTGAGVPISSNVNAPVFDLRQASSRVAIRNGETIVIGGLMQDQRTETIQKVPVLGDVPYLGFFFRRTQNTKTKTELLIFLTPHVALSPDLLKGMSTAEEKNLKLVPNAVQPGTFLDQMKGMEQGAVPIVPRSDAPATTGPVIRP